MRIGLVGCGYIADRYAASMALHPALQLIGVADRDAARAERFGASKGVRVYRALDELLADGQVEMVLNLTNPRSHYEVSKACLHAGKHVYSEKPLAMEVQQAKELVELATARGVRIASAPCSVLGETAQTMWKALREQRVGKVRLVYAEMDDGMVHRMPYRKWLSESGTPWPYKDEFEVGCTMEHAGYCLTWLVAFFGPVRHVTAFSSVQIPDKAPDVRAEDLSADFSVGCLQFDSGVVARLTCSLIAHHDHQLRIFGDEGILWTPDVWDYRSPVYYRHFLTIRRRMILNPLRRKCRLLGKENPMPGPADFARGPAELAAAITEHRPCRLSERFSLHVTELSLALQNARESGLYRMTTTFDPVEPMPWAK